LGVSAERTGNTVRVRSSYRDPSGYIFSHEGVIYRQVNQQYRENYDISMNSGLYDELIPFISYPARLLANREDIFPIYPRQVNFENEFSRFFEIKSVHRIVDSERSRYLMGAR